MIFAGLVAGLVTGFGYAAEVSSDDALCAVKGWVSLKESLDQSIEGNPASVETYAGRDGKGKFYVVTLEGGGYVVASGDDEVTPILAYSKSGTFDASEKNPLWCLLAGRAAFEADRLSASATGGRRLAASASATSGNAAKWSRLRAAGGANGGKTRLGGAPSAAPTDLRVPELLFSDWAQGRIGNWAGTDYPYCFNMYTPEIDGERAPCGCVATSGAQIMRYFQYPTASVTAQTKTCKVSGVDTNLTMMGGTYDWSNMPTNINSMYNQPEANTLAYREAIGKLTYDVGVAVEMWYGANGSGASASDLADALMNVFGYRNAAYFYAEGGLAADKLKKAVLPNLDAKRPCGIGITNTSTESGHAIVADGYGYSDDTLYIHFNMGWNNLAGSNAWYAPPEFDVEEDIQYDTIDEVICNIFTDTGSQFGSIASGRVLDANGNPLAGATVTGTTTLLNGVVTNIVTTSDERGIYAILMPAVDKPCTITASADGYGVPDDISFTIAPTDMTIGNTYDNDITLTEKPKPSKLLDYIESTGAQYIDTGIKARSGTKAEMDMLWTKQVNGSNGFDTYLATSEFSLMYVGNLWYKGVFGSWSKWVDEMGGTYTGIMKLNTRYAVVTEATTDGEWKTDVNGKGASQTGLGVQSWDRTLYMFARNNNNSADQFGAARCYATKIWQTDESGEYKLVRDFLPCLDTDGVACLYDAVTKELFYSKNGTAFVTGSELADFGAPDAFLEYVDSTGAQYIDTGAEAKVGTKAEMKMQWKANRSGYNLDAYLSATSDSGTFHLCDLNYERWWYAACGDWHNYVGPSYITGSTLGPTANLNTDYTVVSEVNQAKEWAMSFGGGSATYATGWSLNTLGVNLYLFACNSSGTAANHATARCYYTKIWQAGANGEYVLVRDFVPCRKDGVAGLYDRVSKSIFYSKTDTAFVDGPLAAEMPDKFVEYVYSDGRQAVDTGVYAKPGTKAEMKMVWNSTSGWTTFLGAQDYGKSAWYILCGQNSAWWYWGADTTRGFISEIRTSSSFMTSAGAVNVIVAEYSEGGVYSINVNNGEVAGNTTVTPTLSSPATRLHLFSNNFGDAYPGQYQQQSSARCYSTKIWQTDASGEYKLVRDYRPCVKGGRPGLYDTLSGKIFYSATGTDLLVDENTEIKPPKFWTDNIGDRSFDNALNWLGGTLPETDDDVTLNVQPDTVIVTTNNYSLGVVTVSSGAVSFGESGAITMKGLSIAFGATAEITGAEGLVDGGVTGAGTLVIAPGDGNTFTMTKNNTGFTGTAVIKNGTVKFGDTRSFGAQPSTIRVRGGAMLDENNLFGDWAYNAEKNKVILEEDATLISENGTFGLGCHITTVTLDGDAAVDTSSGVVSVAYGWDYSLTHINLGEHTLAKTGAEDFYISCCQISGTGMFDIAEGRVVVSPTLYGRGNSSATCADGTIKIRPGASVCLQDKDDDTAGKVTLSVKNLILDGSVTKGTKNEHMLTVTGSITGKGTTPMLTMGSGAKFKPNSTDFLTITDSLSGTMTIDVSELDFTDRKDDVPLFKVGNASILPARGDVAISGELPPPWRLTKTTDGLGYRLNREQGTIITIR
ncbi:MAG: C10 family peptidase [Kiritimatiellae bacterium]|nr:C10 family peptidase [Kiritimatiellia bacterium]